MSEDITYEKAIEAKETLMAYIKKRDKIEYISFDEMTNYSREAMVYLALLEWE